jgi:hypothetical protein
MNASNLSFPYPVLGAGSFSRDDYVDSAYQVTVENKSLPDEDQLVFEYEHACSCPEIVDLINSEKACFAITLWCEITRVNKVFHSFKEHQTIRFPMSSLYGRFKLTPQIIALEDVANYSPEDLHEEFGESVFTLSPGDILAHDDPLDLICDFERTSLESLVSVALKSDLPAHVYEIVIGDHFIRIDMGTDIHSIYRRIAIVPQSSPHIHMSIYKDLHLAVLHELAFTEGAIDTDYGRAWQIQLNELNITITAESTFNDLNKAAQTLVSTRGVAQLLKITQIEGEE